MFSFKELSLTAGFWKTAHHKLEFFNTYMRPETANPNVKYDQERLAPQHLARGNH